MIHQDTVAVEYWDDGDIKTVKEIISANASTTILYVAIPPKLMWGPIDNAHTPSPASTFVLRYRKWCSLNTRWSKYRLDLTLSELQQIINAYNATQSCYYWISPSN